MPTAESWLSPLAYRFVADLLARTRDCGDDDAAHQRTVHAFLDELRPWVHAADCPAPRDTFTVFSEMSLDPDTETVSVAFTPEGRAFFRAWLRRRGLDPIMSPS